MAAPRHAPAAGIAAGVALGALAATAALAQSQDAARTLADGENLVIEGRSFSITPSKNGVATPSDQAGARPLGPGVVIFRRGDGLYMVDRAPPPPAAIPANVPAGERPRADGPRTATVDCGNGWALRDQAADQAAYVPPNPNDGCQHVTGLRDMERQRPHGAGDADSGDIMHMDENPRIHVEYQPPKDPGQQKVYDTVKQRHMLEMVRKVFSPFLLGDINLNIRTVSCGVSNAWYQRVDNVPTVSICYEYLEEIWQSMPEETKEVMGETMKDAVCGQLFFAVAHELGHAMFDIFDVPVFGRQEDAADEFATFIMLQFGGEQALQLIDGAAYGYHAYIKDLSTKPQVTLPLAAFSSDHGAPEERYFNLICIAYGYDERLFMGAMDKIPASRARKCKFEYEDLKYAFHTVFWPHLDHDKVRQVLAMKWIIVGNPSATPSKAN
jgi:hypothetical protein